MGKLLYMQMAPIEFTEWFSKLLQEEDLGIREAARKIGISHPIVSELLEGAHPTEGTCVKIAIAFNFPADFVLAIARYRSLSDEDQLVELIYFLAKQLPNDQEKNDAAEYLRMRLRLIDRRDK
jgi:transcriptional regulator with XRE-family HTH domain